MKKILLLLVVLGLAACGTDWSAGPDDGGSTYRKAFRYYYGEDCRYDAFGQVYDCMDYYALNPSMQVSLSITYDGYATLCVDNLCSYYDPGEYSDGFDEEGHYYDFEGDDMRMVVYTSGNLLLYIDSYKGTASYYFYDYRDYEYDY